MNEEDIFGDDASDELARLTPEDIQRRGRLLENETRILKVLSALFILVVSTLQVFVSLWTF